MLDDLAERATSGNADINVVKFLRKYDLSVPITNWLILKNDCASILNRHLRNRNYNSSQDVRLERIQDMVTVWTKQTPILVFSGKSGQGKTWALYGATYLLAEQRLVVAIEAKGDADKDIEKASQFFCEEIWKKDTTQSLNRISALLTNGNQNASPHWLTLCIDDVQNVDEARALSRMDWEGWGVRLLVSCSDNIAEVFVECAKSRVKRIGINDFTLKDLHTYLSKRVGINWPRITQDVRDTLRLPLLADLYRTIAAGEDWQPANEYELYSCYWQRIRTQEAGAYALDEALLSGLAQRLLTGTSYPWSGRHLLSADIDNAVIARLTKAGWLQTTSDGHYEITHARLLNWAVAEGLVAAYREHEIDDANLCNTVQKLFHSEILYSNQNLNGVPVDVLWLLTRLTPSPDSLIDRIILALERGDWRLQSELYKNLLPTLGARIASALVRRLETLTPDEAVLAFDIYDALAQFPGEIVAPEALRLLKNPLPAARLRGCCVFNHCPSAAALDALWNVRCDIHQNSALYVEEQEQGSMAHRAEREALDALRACIPLYPEWLPAAVEAADPLTMPVSELPHLVAAIEGHSEIWKQCKETLFIKIAPEQDQMLACDIYVHRDAEAIPWLQKRIRRTNDWGAALALAAITRIDPDLALRELSDASVFAVGLNKIWCFSHLLFLRPEATRACILRQLQQSIEPWEVANAYNGSQDLMDAPTLEMLLDALEVLLDKIRAGELPSTSAPLFHPLSLLTGIHRLDLLDCFTSRLGSTLEEKLASWLLDEAEKEYFALQHDAEDALTLLDRIGGAGYTRVVNRMITSPSMYARYDGLRLAHKRPDAETFCLLEQVSLQEDEGNSRRMAERGKAILALARSKRWAAFIRAVTQCEFTCPSEVAEECLITAPLDNATMAPAFASLDSPDPSIGAILAVGLGQRKDRADTLCDLLERSPAASSMAWACVEALGYMGDSGERAVPLLEAQLAAPGHYNAAWIALLRHGSEKAIDALLKRLKASYHSMLAINLLRRPRVKDEVAQLMREYLNAEGITQQSGSRAFEELTVYIDDELSLADVLQGDDIEEHLRRSATGAEDWIWYRRAKASAIRALSVSNRNEAYETALAALGNLHSRDRERYPEILIQLAEEQAVTHLFEQMTVEKQTAVRWAIARALSQCDLDAILESKFVSQDERERRTSCQIAGHQPDISPMGAGATVLLERRFAFCGKRGRRRASSTEDEA